MRAFFFMALVTCSVAPAVPASAAAAPIVAPDTQALASQLTELTFPAEMIHRDSLKAFADNFRASYLSDPKAQAVHERMPGLLDAMIVAGSAKLSETFSALLQELKASLSAAYGASLNPNELKEAVTFYSSPAGKNLIAATPALAGGAELRTVLSSAEMADFTKFSRSSAGRKLEALKPSQSAEITNAVSRIVSIAQPQINAAVVEAGQAYLRAQPR